MIPRLSYHCLNKGGKGYIRLRFSHNGKKIDLYPPNKLTVKFTDWNKNNQNSPIKNSDIAHREKNGILVDFKQTIENTLRILQIKGLEFTKDNIEFYILTERASSNTVRINYPITDILTKWKDFIVDSKIKSLSYRKTVKSVYNFFIKFFATKEGSKYNSFDDINRTFFDEYYSYCIKHLEYSNDTIKKHLYTFKTFLRWAMDNKYHSVAITNYIPKMAVGKHDIIFLNEDEVLAIWNFTDCEFENYINDEYVPNEKHNLYTTEYVHNERKGIKGNKGGDKVKILTNWELVRDMYIFSCVTGLRYSDVVNLNCDCIEDNGDVISIVPQKTQKSGIRVNIPMAADKDNIMRRIFWKYVSGKLPNQYVFPRTKFGNAYPNQKINVILKEICNSPNLCKILNRKISVQLITGDKIKEGTEGKKEIKDIISFHSARRTYATRAMKIIGDADQIMKITGHLNKRVFHRYVGVNEKNLDKLSKMWNESKMLNEDEDDSINSSKTPKELLVELNELLKDKLITKKEFETKRKEILSRI